MFGLLGTLKCLGEEVPELAEGGPSAVRYGEVFDNDKLNILFFGGDRGGWIVTDGGAVTGGRECRVRVGESERLPEPFVRGGCKPS